MNFKARTIGAIATMICGGTYDKPEPYFVYRSGYDLTRFFWDCDTDYQHDGSTRTGWVESILGEILQQPQPNEFTPPDTFARIIENLMDQEDAKDETHERVNCS